MMKSISIAIAATVLSATAAMADGDATKGQQVFKKCQACHAADSTTNKVGPYLKCVIGRAVGTAEGYAYSDAMKEFAATGAKWDEETLDKYLADPKAVVPKTKMSFAGLKKEDERENVIAFLKTMN